MNKYQKSGQGSFCTNAADAALNVDPNGRSNQPLSFKILEIEKDMGQDKTYVFVQVPTG